MNANLNAALDYHCLGLVVVPIVRGTKVPAVKWTEYRLVPPSERQLTQWFGEKNYQPAIVCGPGSGGLVVRDFDTRASYECWAGEHPDLSGRLPTALTFRGAHVYCRLGPLNAGWPHCRVRIIRVADGELKSDGYVLAPPAVHPSGHNYSWLVPPAGEIPRILIADAGLLSADIPPPAGPRGPRSALQPVDAIERDAAVWKKAFGLA